MNDRKPANRQIKLNFIYIFLQFYYREIAIYIYMYFLRDLLKLYLDLSYRILVTLHT